MRTLIHVAGWLVVLTALTHGQDPQPRVGVDFSGQDVFVVVKRLIAHAGVEIKTGDLSFTGQVYILGEKEIDRRDVIVLLDIVLRRAGYCLWPPPVPGSDTQADPTEIRAMESAGVEATPWLEVKLGHYSDWCPSGTEWAIGIVRLRKLDLRAGFIAAQTMANDPRWVYGDDPVGTILLSDRPGVVGLIVQVLTDLDKNLAMEPPPPAPESEVAPPDGG